jgi:hypothetical protein
MKIKVNLEVKKEVDIKFVKISIPICEKDVSHDFPLEFDDVWIGVVDIETGVVQYWEEGCEGTLYAKVVDRGSYSLMDANENEICVFEGYVPNQLLPPIKGYGDYIELIIDENGKITNWYEKPSLEDFEYADFSIHSELTFADGILKTGKQSR